MTLTLSIVRCPDAAVPERREVSGGELSIGRAPDNGWVLRDPAGHLSRRHCVIAFRAGTWQVADTSSNGTFLNREPEPIGPASPRPLREGDRLRLGDYEIEVAIAEPFFGGRAQPASDPFGSDPFGSDPFGGDKLLGRERAPERPAHSVLLPPDFDPLAPDADAEDFGAPTQPDHAPAIEQAFRPPPLAGAGLPDDWDLDIAGAPPTPPQPAAGAPVALARPPAPAPAPATADLLTALLRGAKAQDAHPSDPAAAMEALGAAIRAMVAGLRRALIARAAIKGEFRIEQTMVRARGNNPLKFSADDDDALAALLGTGRRTDMTPEAAVADALRDMRLHELATMAAMQAAVRELVARFDPAPIARAAEQSGRAMLPAQRRARAWEAFEALHGKITAGLADDFDAVFGRTFARAYEQALRDVSDRDEPR